jgi:VIT1/CCC1 family predicted Fe2+/Mn2+ transporter
MAKPRVPEKNYTGRVGWLRAAVLGANDGLLSTSSLILGVAAANGTSVSILVAGIAGLVAGALSMAAGEYVSVSSQADTESAALAVEAQELKQDKAGELTELAGIYQQRGLDPALARQVAEQLMAHDALAAHARDELGISDELKARPIQAAFASAASFSCGAGVPLLVTVFAPSSALIWAVALVSALCLAALGTLAAQAGGAPLLRGALRVSLWGIVAMIVTAGIGALFGTVF